jgi:hypothetical protein
MQGNAQFRRAQGNVADKSIFLEINRHFPASIICPAESPVDPNTDFVLATASVGQVFEADVGVIKVVNEAVLVQTNEELSIT